MLHRLDRYFHIFAAGLFLGIGSLMLTFGVLDFPSPWWITASKGLPWWSDLTFGGIYLFWANLAYKRAGGLRGDK